MKRGKRGKQSENPAEPIPAAERITAWLGQRGIADAAARVARLSADEQAVIVALLNNPKQPPSPQTRHALYLLGSLVQALRPATTEERLAAYNRILSGDCSDRSSRP